MLVSAAVSGWLGVFVFLMISLTFQKMAKNNEFAFLHFVMALMYTLWFPLPIALNQLMDSDYLQIGTIFYSVY